MERMQETLAAIRRSAGEVPILRPETETVLRRLVVSKQPLRLLEVGTAIGYSTLLLAMAMPPQAFLTSLELDAARAAAAAQNIAAAGLSGRVRIVTGDAADTISRLQGPFDFVFLDGPKGQYLAHLQLLLDKLSAEATVVADNVLFRGMVGSTAAPPRRYRTLVNRLRQYLAFVSTDARFSTTLLPEGDGVAVSCYQIDRGDANEES
ncbi:MAG: O-methyltransferase [Sporomusaceae bacterium]|nr:O-methyltransferase [Sporomusaceae bacterium]